MVHAISIVFVVLLPVAYLWKPDTKFEDKAPVCRTRICSERGSLYYDNMDANADPCEDFFQFACGAWTEVNPRPQFYMDWTVQTLMDLNTKKTMRDILTRPSGRLERQTQRWVKAAYQFCLRIPELSRGSIGYIYNHLNTAMRYIRHTVWEVHDALLKISGESAFFQYRIRINNDDAHRPILEIRDPMTIYGSIYHAKRWTPSEREHYALFLKDIYKAIDTVISEPLSDVAIDNEVNELINFRWKLNKINIESWTYSDGQIKLMTVNELQQYYSQLITKALKADHKGWAVRDLNSKGENFAKKQKSTEINWERIVKILYTDYRAVTNSRIISLRSTNYFINLEKLLADTPQKVAINHVKIYFIEKHLRYSQRMLDKLTDTFSRGIKPTGFLRTDTPRWVTCLQMEGTEHEVGRVYADHHYNGEVNRQVRVLMNNLKQTMKSEIKESTWLKGSPRTATLTDIDDIHNTIGYPEWYFNPNLKVEMDDPPPLQANAYFDILTKDIYIAANLLQSPMFQLGMPSVLNIAGLGSAIGHELYHLLGDCGIIRSSDELRYFSSWTTEMRYLCQKQKACFVDVYNNYTRIKLENIVDPAEVNAERTFMEDVADVMGLQLAYRFFSGQIRGNLPQCQVLPFYEDYTCDQMFYIAFANSKCGVMDRSYLSKKFTQFYHSEHSIRVNGAVMNDKNFAKAFGCPLGSTMNPVKKCNLWRPV